jgi:hypothetical protein
LQIKYWICVIYDNTQSILEQLITVSVKVIGLSTSDVWSGIGDDNKINANEMVATTLSGTVAIIGTTSVATMVTVSLSCTNVCIAL